MKDASKPDGTFSLDDPALYVNRELSWLAFNERVLDQARDRRWPLLERLKFLAIFGSNLDEFFMIRVAGLHAQLEADVGPTPDGLDTSTQLADIRRTVGRYTEEASALLSRDLLPELEASGLKIASWGSLDAETHRLAAAYFRTAVFPVLTPLAVDPGHPFPFVSNLSLSLAVEVRDPLSGERKFARVKVPETLPRFVPLDDIVRVAGGGAGTGVGAAAAAGATARFAGRSFLPLEQLIGAHLDQLFPGMEILARHPFRVTRDMELEILDEADDLLAVVHREVRQRRFGACVRLEIDTNIPARLRTFLLENLDVDEEDLYESQSLLGLSALMSIAALHRPDLHDPPFSPQRPTELPHGADVFSVMRAGEVLLHHPYDSFEPVLEFLNQSASDPQVLAIKMTLYRAGLNADALRALVRAAENGKQVAVSIEIKARFDEENNIIWARRLERAGVHVFFGTAETKTHAKVALVVRREAERLVRYVHLSTGNYNAGTARLYTDIGFLTTDPDIGEDASELFNSLSGFSRAHYRKLAVAPAELRAMILAKIDEQTDRATAGKPARIFAKMNSLVDVSVIRALYDASIAGVEIDLVIRGICCLRPGLPGVSERIRVISVLGRFLEHERVFVFGPEGAEEFYLGSADWMPRNFDRRVEVLFPIESATLREQIRREAIAPALVHDAAVYEMDSQGVYRPRGRDPGVRAKSPQDRVFESIVTRGRKAPDGQASVSTGVESRVSRTSMEGKAG